MVNLTTESKPSVVVSVCRDNTDGTIDLFYNDVLVAFINTTEGEIVRVFLSEEDKERLWNKGVRFDNDRIQDR